jgi:hypothetical protein
MQKLLRSLFAVGALATLAACGDDVSIVEPDNVVISGAPTTAIKVGDVVQLSANVAVSWSSAAPAVATVDPASGLVTAVGAGIVSVTATSQADAAKKASVTITVTGNISPSVSIFAVTQGGTNNPVNPQNVQGNIDVVVNMDPGDFTVASLDLLVDGAVAQTQTFAQALVEPKPVDEEMAAQVQQVSFTLNTADFDPTTGAVEYTNGTHTISARVTVTGGGSGGAAEPSRTLTFNNQSGFVAIVSNTNTVGGPASAINSTTGLRWVQGDVTLKLAAVNYSGGGATVTSVNGNFLDHSFDAEPDAGTQIFTILFENDDDGDFPIDNYQTPPGSSESIPVVTASALSTGSQGPTNIINVGSGAADAGLTPLDSTRVDNVPPAAPTVGTFPTWINHAFTFSNSSASISGLTDAGVGGVTTEFWVINDDLPDNCDLDGMTEVTTSSGLDTTVTTDYNGKVLVQDALGNAICAPLGGGAGTAFGVDIVPPNDVDFDGVDNNEVFNSTATAQGTNYDLTSSGDNASGVGDALISILRMDADDDDDCIVGDDCDPETAATSGSITGGSTDQGYFTLTAQLMDNAGNAAPVPAFSRLFLVDEEDPTFNGNVGLEAQYAGNAAATFNNLNAEDNLDLARLFGVVAYNVINIEYPSLSLGSFGTPFETDFEGDYTIPSLLRCIAAQNQFGQNAANEAQQIFFFAEDFAGNQGVVAPVAGALLAALDNCGAVGNLSAPAAINTFSSSAPDYGSGNTQVSIEGETDDENSDTVVLEAVADVTLDNAPQPFTRVEFYYQNASGFFVKIGEDASGSLLQNGTRTWTYSFTWNPDSSVPENATTNVIAIGVDAQGDAVITNVVVVNVVE